MSRRSSLPLVLLILMVGFTVRILDLMAFPVFYDEAVHLRAAHEIVTGRIFTGLHESNWFYSVVLAVFNPTGPEGMWLARAVTALAALVTLAVGIALGTSLADQRTGLLAGLIYALLPMAVFHERQALTDPLMATFTGLSVWLIAVIARRPRPGYGLALALCLALGYLTKLLAVPYLILPLAGSILLARWDRRIWKPITISILSSILAVFLIRQVYQIAISSGTEISARYAFSTDNTMLGRLASPEMFARLRNDISIIEETLWRYFGWAAIGLLALCPVWMGKSSHRRAILYLSAPGIAFAALPLLIRRTTGGDLLPPRYFISHSLPVVVLVALSLISLVDWLRPRLLRLGAAAGVILAGAVLLPALAFDAHLIRDPKTVTLTEVDSQQQYRLSFAGDYSDLAAVLLVEWQAHDGQRLTVFTTGFEQAFLPAYLGPRLADVIPFSGDADAEQVAAAVGRGEQVYFVEIVKSVGSTLIPLPAELASEPLGTFTGFTNTLALHRINGATGSLAVVAAAASTPESGRMSADFQALSGLLGAEQVLVYPAGHAPALAASSGADITGLSPDRWPPDRAAGEEAVGPLAALADGTLVSVVLVDEARSDPARALTLAMGERFYRLDEAWAGLLHRITYVAGPAEPDLPAREADFGGLAALDAGGPLEREIQPGGLLRMLLVWRAAAPIPDSYKVFVHVAAPDGTIPAQHDSIPGAGLFPTTDWIPGQPVTDRFALRLPPDMPPGEYEVRIGLYLPETGARLALVDGTDYVSLGWIVCGRQD